MKRDPVNLGAMRFRFSGAGATLLLGLAFAAIFFAARLGSDDCLGVDVPDRCRLNRGAFYLDFGIVLIVSLALASALRGLGRGGRYTCIARLVTLLLALAIPAVIIHIALMHNPQGEFCVYTKTDGGDLLARVLGQDPCTIVWHQWLMLGAVPAMRILPFYVAIWAFIDHARD